MPIFDDGDPVRGLGFVTMYFAHLEDGVDRVLDATKAITAVPERLENYRVGDKVRFLRKALRKALQSRPTPYPQDDERQIKRVLRACKAVIAARNDLLHQPIFADMRGGQYQQKWDGPRRKILSRDIYQLANVIHNVCGGIYSLEFVVGRICRANASETN
jgi:hypothetical protein